MPSPASGSNDKNIQEIRRDLRLASDLRQGSVVRSSSPLSILLIEDNSGDADLVSIHLEEAGLPSPILVVKRLDEAVSFLETNSVDVVLADLSLPDAHGLDVVLSVRESAPEAAIVVLSGLNNETVALEAVKLGAQDYLIKGKDTYPVLHRTILYAYERRAVESKLASMAYYDKLTGLVNRNAFVEKFTQAAARSSRMESKMALLFIDVNKFKDINDTLGHDAGDYLLKQVAVRLQDCVRPYDTVARYGGDEFIVLLEDYHCDEASLVKERLTSVFSAPFLLGNNEVEISVSVGCASCPADGTDLTSLLHIADAKMYQDKKGSS